jgi:hypothetical protein
MMKSMSKVLLLGLAALMVAQTVASAAPVTVTGIAAVESRRVASSVTGTNSNTSTLTIKNGTGAWTKSWIKWDLSSIYAANPGLKGHITGATLTMTSNTTSSNKPLNIAGVNDSYLTNIGWTSGGAAGITRSNAPGNSTAAALVDASATTVIASGMSVSTTSGTAIVLLNNTQALIDFLNADTDGIVQLIMYNGGQLDFQTHLLSPGPRLDITANTPEPATLAILGLGGLLLRRRLA